MADPGGAVAANQQQQPAGRSWVQTIVQIVLFQMVMRYFSPARKAPEPVDHRTGAIIPPLANVFPLAVTFDVYAYLSPYPIENITALVSPSSPAELIWFLPSEVYLYDRSRKDRQSKTLQYTPPLELYDALTTQHLDSAGQVEDVSGPPVGSSGGGGVLEKLSGLNERIMGGERMKKRRELLAQWESVYLVVSAVPHTSYNESQQPLPEDLSRALYQVGTKELSSEAAASFLVEGKRRLSAIDWEMPVQTSEDDNELYDERLLGDAELERSIDSGDVESVQQKAQTPAPVKRPLFKARPMAPYESIKTSHTSLIEYMKPQSTEESLQSLLGGEGSSKRAKEESSTGPLFKDEAPHWKDHIDIRLVVDSTFHTPQSLAQPHLQRHVEVLPAQGKYKPILQLSDMWLLERNFIALNETLRGAPLNFTMSFNTLNGMWWMVQSQLGDVWDPSKPSTNPIVALQSHTRRETFMLKRIILDTNPYFLAFSGLFMLLHTLFSFLAFKNEIQFWHKNDSMEGLSALSIVSSFICEIIIGLYLYDSEETSFLILFEIFLGIAISAWKVTKALTIRLDFSTWRILKVESGKNYKETETKRYDETAIKFMSMLLFPCMAGYAIYALKYKKYKSWYSYLVSTLAGTVYTFGFVMMTPQLYINYKLQSVDHLPWRALVYKALNTFVDDVAAFIIDMPWMHRLACFRDDIIFVLYIYQRYAYRVDKTRPSEWVKPDTVAAPLEEEESQALLAKGDGDASTEKEDSQPSAMANEVQHTETDLLLQHPRVKDGISELSREAAAAESTTLRKRKD